MTVLKLTTRLPRGVRLRSREVKVRDRKVVTVIAAKNDYNGMSSEAWKVALLKDVSERFGSTPADLIPVGEAGW